MIDKSETGWIILCETCCSQTATTKEDGRYFCKQCFEGGDEEIEVDDIEEEYEIVCECGGKKTGTICSDWCPTNE